MRKAPPFHEMDPKRIREILEGHEDMLTPKAQAFVAAKEAKTCPECGAVLKYRLTDIRNPFDKDGLPRLTGDCEICGFSEELEV